MLLDTGYPWSCAEVFEACRAGSSLATRVKQETPLRILWVPSGPPASPAASGVFGRPP